MVEIDWRASDDEIAALVGARHGDPFGFLGLHETSAGKVIRAFVPGATAVGVLDATAGAIGTLTARGGAGFFEGLVPTTTVRTGYVLRASNDDATWDVHDPYAFGPVLGPIDDYLLGEGTHRALYDKLGAHPLTHEGVAGTAFALWAPNAQRVSVVGDFNAWDGRRHQMRKRVTSGLWEIFAPGVGPGAAYKFELVGAHGGMLPLKADPFAFHAEVRPSTASIVLGKPQFSFDDEDYLAQRATRDQRRAPMSIYEVHLGSWRRNADGSWLGYDALAEQLIPYVRDLGFTHIELMPISEHPLDISWGYQPIGLFAPTSRFGDPAGFARFVAAAHAAGLGVFIDWVPAHFPVDVHGLAHFDGTALYEHADPRQGFHPDWNTAIYNVGRVEVSNILAANALFWLDRYHIDGLRVDAVASMLYLDYSRKAGEWVPNADGTNDNRESVAFLRKTNELAYSQVPGIAMIAEESTAWKGVSSPTSAGGLGFGFKWNMGWMHDSLEYMEKDPIYRRWNHEDMTFSMDYAFDENFVLPLSHDEVVHGKKSIVSKMPGDDWQKFANTRAYYGFMWGHPGKKLLFMGQEFGQWGEWSSETSLDWHYAWFDLHKGLTALVSDLNKVYRSLPALFARDCEPEGFRWVVAHDAEASVFAWLRLAPGEAPVLVVSNMTPVVREGYRIGVPEAGFWREVINTDASLYGGSNVGNEGGRWSDDVWAHDHGQSLALTLPPLATLYLLLDR